nr:hypothetical protein [uncultured Halomonas sp.]
MSLPAWDSRGVLPPIHPEAEGHSSHRSPYKSTLPAFIERFATTRPRIALLDKLLNYRSDLHAAGIVKGFQWINGSFVQDVELLESRPPNDIDIVTHFYVPDGHTQQTIATAYPYLITPPLVKQTYGMDAYPNVLGGEANAYFAKRITYWYSMWSHRKIDNAWKGFVEIDLSALGDAPARDALRDASDSLEGGSDE